MSSRIEIPIQSRLLDRLRSLAAAAGEKPTSFCRKILVDWLERLP